MSSCRSFGAVVCTVVRRRVRRQPVRRPADAVPSSWGVDQVTDHGARDGRRPPDLGFVGPDGKLGASSAAPSPGRRTTRSFMFDGRWRTAVDRTTSPVGEALHRHGITADVLTATGLVSATATAVLVATGHLHWAIVMLIVTGMHDLLDGPVAKAAGTASVRGAFFDSVTDRVADAVLMIGCAWYLLDQGRGHLALLPMAHPGGDRADLLRAGQGGVPRSLGQGRPDGAGRAHVPARRRLLELRDLRARPLGPLRARLLHRRSPASSRSGTLPPAATRSSAVASRPGGRAESTRAGGPGARAGQSAGRPRRHPTRARTRPGPRLAAGGHGARRLSAAVRAGPCGNAAAPRVAIPRPAVHYGRRTPPTSGSAS